MTNALPKAIQKQIEDAEALHKELYGPKDAPAPEDTGNTEQNDEPQLEQGQPAPEAKPKEAQPVQEAPPPSDEYKQKYDVLRGKYDAEVPRLNAQLRQTTEQLNTLAAELDKLKAKPEPVAQAPVEERFLNDKDAEVFGADLVDMAERAAKQAVNAAKKEWSSEKQKLQEKIEQLSKQLGSVDQQVTDSAEERFYSTLASKVPDWEAINQDERFLAWLAEVDPIYGQPRQVALNDAHRRFDAARVANIFRAFAPAQPVQAPTPRQPSPELQRQVAPSTSRASAPAAPQGKLWTKAEYEHAFDHRTERQVGREAAEKLRREADQAALEGRVQW